MKRMLLFAVLSLTVLDSPAQKVYKEGGKVIFEAAGTPKNSYTRTQKPRTTDGTNSTKGSNTATNISSAVNNEKIAYRFEIAASNNSAASTWLDAVNLCAGLSGGNWRLPTLRELQMIWVMHEKLKTLSGFTSFSVDSAYWCATEDDSYSYQDSFYLHTNYGGIKSFPKTLTYVCRCIRDF